jgi:hypothetical protein
MGNDYKYPDFWRHEYQSLQLQRREVAASEEIVQQGRDSARNLIELRDALAEKPAVQVVEVERIDGFLKQGWMEDVCDSLFVLGDGIVEGLERVGLAISNVEHVIDMQGQAIQERLTIEAEGVRDNIRQIGSVIAYRIEQSEKAITGVLQDISRQIRDPGEDEADVATSEAQACIRDGVQAPTGVMAEQFFQQSLRKTTAAIDCKP